MAGVGHFTPVSVAPAISQFNAEMQAGDLRRRQEEQDYFARLDRERSMGLDKGLRNAFAQIYAQPSAAAPAPMALPPPPAAVSGPTAAAPIPPMIAYPGAPASPVMPDNSPMGFGNDAPLPPAQANPFAGIQAGPAGPVIQPPAAAPAPAVAAPASSVRPPPAERTRSTFGPIMSELAKTPGAGATMASMFGKDLEQQGHQRQQDRQIRAEGTKMMLTAIKDGDIGLAKSTAAHYGLEVPDAVWSNRDVMVRFRIATQMAEKIKGLEGDKALAFVAGYMNSGDPDPGRATQAGIDAARKIPTKPQVAGHYITEQGTPAFYGKQGENVGAPDQPFPKARKTATELRIANPGASKSAFDRKREAWIAANPGDEQGALQFASGQRVVPPAQLVAWAEAAVDREARSTVGGMSPAEKQAARTYYYEQFGVKSGGKPSSGAPKPVTGKRERFDPATGAFTPVGEPEQAEGR